MTAVSPILRDSVPMVDAAPGSFANLLAVDPNTLPQVAWFRDDFAGKSLTELVSPLTARAALQGILGEGIGRGILIPEGGETVGVWANLETLDSGILQGNLNLWARVSDSKGIYRSLPLGDLVNDVGEEPWNYLEASLVDVSPPVVLSGFHLTTSGSFGRIPEGLINLDDITVKGGALPEEGIVVEGFEEPSVWVPLSHEERTPDVTEISSRGARTGNGGLAFSWQELFRTSNRGMYIPSGPFPLPAIGSPHFLPGQVIRIKLGRQVLPVVVEDTTGFFPTMDPAIRPILIVNFEQFRQLVSLLPQAFPDDANEVWLALDPSADRTQVKRLAGEQLPGFGIFRDRAERVEVAERNPLAGGGWNGLTILSIAAVVAAVVLTLAVHAVVAVRTGRVDMVVARALGFSGAQSFLALSVERGLVAVIGLAAGAVVGLWPGRYILELLDVTTSGRPATPPMIPDVQLWLLAVSLGSLAGAALLGLLLSAVSSRRLKAIDVLRIG